MLVSAVLKLKTDVALTLPATLGRAANACFLGMVRSRNPELADKIHEMKKNKPLTVSPLQGSFSPENGLIRLSPGNEYWIRFTSIDESLTEVVLSICQHPPDTIVLANRTLNVLQFATDAADHPWARTARWEDLYNKWMVEQDGCSNKIRMQFLSPTTFRSGGRNLPFPLMQLVFLNLVSKWNEYSPIFVGDEEVHSLVDAKGTLSRYESRTKMYDFGPYRQVGFVGECEYGLLKLSVEEEEWLKVFHMLADFAFFAGVGYKTTMGMGQARKVD